MADAVKDDPALSQRAPAAQREKEAQKRGGNPDKPPSANAGNVSVGGTEPQPSAETPRHK
jgi:hypothetical protein